MAEVDNRFANHMSNYGIIADKHLPDDVRDELCNDCPSNDSGILVNPQYRAKFKEWLQAQGMPVVPYIVWFSW